MNRNPEFIVKMVNRAAGGKHDTGYARRVGNKWLLTQVESVCCTFYTHHEAAAVKQELVDRHDNNAYVSITIVRTDLCDSIIEDIDNLSVM